MNNKYKVAFRIAWRRVEDEAVVLDLNTSAYFALNAVGARIWELLAEGRSLEQISKIIAEEYDTDRKAAESDARALLADLRREKLLEPA